MRHCREKPTCRMLCVTKDIIYTRTCVWVALFFVRPCVGMIASPARPTGYSLYGPSPKSSGVPPPLQLTWASGHGFSPVARRMVALATQCGCGGSGHPVLTNGHAISSIHTFYLISMHCMLSCFVIRRFVVIACIYVFCDPV